MRRVRRTPALTKQRERTHVRARAHPYVGSILVTWHGPMPETQTLWQPSRTVGFQKTLDLDIQLKGYEN